MAIIPGIEGYGRATKRFIDISQALDFRQVCRDFLAYLPTVPSRVLDAGSGAGQNAAALAEMGHTVVAVEPMTDFLAAARAKYSYLNITWLDDSLPKLERLGADTAIFKFILVDGVWHHLSQGEREAAIERFAGLLDVRGRCALSLRHGPPGLGIRTYPTNARQTIHLAAHQGFKCIFLSENQPSMLARKENVTWSRIVLERLSLMDIKDS